ncbi:hypothetical protein D910_07000 [Dendroctonus ponderosae]|uniref:Histone-lysine N-methyltransferase n=1 Tax=Dendroctonus ponderosae TaxID=77166 RepID=U4UIB6_DENPD|nr:hypothetical protein D910_07000 [Dendroctonus ponderosae]
MGLAHPGGPVALPPSLLAYPPPPTFDRRPLLLELVARACFHPIVMIFCLLLADQEQPLLLEDLLEQEKREQEKQHQTGPERAAEPEPALLSDHDFERLKADVFSSEAGPSAWPPTRPAPAPTQHTTEITTRIKMFNANVMPAPPLPPDNAVTEQDKQAQIVYEQWLNHQNNVLSQQLSYYDTEVQKLRKSRKSLNSKQRQLRKTGNQLNEVDAAEFQRISAEQAILQKHLESSRKQSRQHTMLIQEYRNKQQSLQKAPVGTSPIHHSPMMSPQRSPMNSPGPMVAHSPALLPSPGGSPGSTPSPSQVCLPPPAPRMTSPQHRRVVTSPSYATELRNNVNQMRFMRPTAVVDHQRVRSQTPNPHQALLQKQLHQQALLHQQQGDANQAASDGSGVLHSPRVAQLIQHRNLSRQQQMSPQQHQMAMQLQARLQQQQQQSPQSPIMPPKSPLHSQQPPNMSPHSMPSSPMPPKSPLLGFNTPGSPVGRATYQPNSPMMMQYQPPSPLMRRPPSVENPRTPYSMDAHLPDHGGGGGNPNNPLNPVPLAQPECDFSRLGLRGGAQVPPTGFRFSKLGLKGGAPMWGGFGRGEKRVPTPPTAEGTDSDFIAKPKKEPHISKVSILKKKTAVPKSSPKMSKEVGDFEGESTKKDLTEMVVDFEDDNSSVLASEVSLSSAAQQNDDELEMTETLSQDDIGEVLASPMEADQISDEFLLFQGNMVVDLSGNAHYSDKEETEEEYPNIVIRSPTTSDDEFIMQGRTKKYNIMDVESPEPDTNTEPEDEEPTEESEVVIIDQAEEQISTKEDFEELIDEGSRKKTDFQKFTATSVYSFPPKPLVRPIVSKATPKISLITPTIIQNFAAPTLGAETQQLILTPTSKITTTSAGSKLTSIILTHNAMRSNLFKAGTASPGITIVSASTSQIASILPSKFTVPVISASAVRQLPNVKGISYLPNLKASDRNVCEKTIVGLYF